MEQMPLINYQSLSTTKAVKAAQRARANATTSSKSKMTPASNSPAGTAVPLEKDLNTSRASSLDRTNKFHTAGLGTTEAEFNLPDEDRILGRLWIARCKCGYAAMLQRKAGKYSVQCAREYMRKRGDNLPEIGCPEPTPWLNSSAAAIRVWTLTQKLTQP